MVKVRELSFVIVSLLTGCIVKQPTTQGPMAPGPGGAGTGGASGGASAAASGDTPIDPTGEMPEGTLTTNASLALDQPAKVMVDARSDIYSSAMPAADEGRGGKLPAQITLAGGTGVIQFPTVVGKAGCQADAIFGPDGGDCVGGDTALNPAGRYSGIVAHDRSLFLVGVFVGPAMPPQAPQGLDFTASALGTSFRDLSPTLGQVFFIGDGKTGTGTGDLQSFKIPAGATHLYLGYADGYAFQGDPGAYGDNKGGVAVTLVQHAR